MFWSKTHRRGKSTSPPRTKETDSNPVRCFPYQTPVSRPVLPVKRGFGENHTDKLRVHRQKGRSSCPSTVAPRPTQRRTPTSPTCTPCPTQRGETTNSSFRLGSGRLTLWSTTVPRRTTRLSPTLLDGSQPKKDDRDDPFPPSYGE